MFPWFSLHTVIDAREFAGKGWLSWRLGEKGQKHIKCLDENLKAPMPGLIPQFDSLFRFFFVLISIQKRSCLHGVYVNIGPPKVTPGGFHQGTLSAVCTPNLGRAIRRGGGLAHHYNVSSKSNSNGPISSTVHHPNPLLDLANRSGTPTSSWPSGEKHNHITWSSWPYMAQSSEFVV